MCSAMERVKNVAAWHAGRRFNPAHAMTSQEHSAEADHQCCHHHSCQEGRFMEGLETSRMMQEPFTTKLPQQSAGGLQLKSWQVCRHF